MNSFQAHLQSALKVCVQWPTCYLQYVSWGCVQLLFLHSLEKFTNTLLHPLNFYIAEFRALSLYLLPNRVYPLANNNHTQWRND